MSDKAKLVIGLMSGTSGDGVDAALVAVHGVDLETRPRLLAHTTVSYPPAVRKLVLALRLDVPATKLARANFLLGELFAEAALEVARLAGVEISQVALIGSHGHTVTHLPEPKPFFGRPVAATLQIGEPAVIAERTGVTTVADFRPADVAAGGQGAPLVPYVDYILFRHESRGRIALNTGGIANITWLPPGCALEDIVAFDTGPGNMVLDVVARALLRRPYDPDGRVAARGRPLPGVLSSLMKHPYFSRKPPKSTGREVFGLAFAEKILRKAPIAKPPDVLATALELTVRTIADGCRPFMGDCREVIASGGGCHNKTLMSRLAEAIAPVPLKTSDEFGIPADAKEAVAFAILANETAAGRPTNVPSATGASRPVVLGKITPGRRAAP